MDLAAYRASAEGFVSEQTNAFYRHYAGLDDEYALEPIYRRHAELFTPESIEGLHARLSAAAPDSEERRRLTLLLDLTVEGFVGLATKELEAELAHREAMLTIELDGQRLGFRQSAVVQANEPDAAVRAEIAQRRLQVIEDHLDGLHRELIGRQHERAQELGYGSYREMCEVSKGIDLGALEAQTHAFSDGSEPAYPRLLEPQLDRVLGFGMDHFQYSDLPRFFRAPDADASFPAGRLVPALLDTLRGLGIGRQDNVVLDTEPRPKKSPRAFCAPVRVPGEVYLVIAPVGGRDDFSALFHEAGHTEHYAHVEPELPFEFRYLGDNSITEAFAFLFQHLVENPEWLERRLGLADPTDAVAYARAHRLIYLRRYAAKLAYELALHGPDPQLGRLPERYGALLSDALKVRWPRQLFLADVDPGFYCACYLRAWALETHIRAHLREQFGPVWFESPEAGALLRSLWREGQRLTPEELLSQIGRGPLDFRVLLDDLDI